MGIKYICRYEGELPWLRSVRIFVVWFVCPLFLECPSEAGISVCPVWDEHRERSLLPRERPFASTRAALRDLCWAEGMKGEPRDQSISLREKNKSVAVTHSQVTLSSSLRLLSCDPSHFSYASRHLFFSHWKSAQTHRLIAAVPHWCPTSQPWGDLEATFRGCLVGKVQSNKASIKVWLTALEGLE